MMLRRHFHSYLDEVRREGRYRIFADLERDAARPPYARWRDGTDCRPCGCIGIKAEAAVTDATHGFDHRLLDDDKSGA